MFLVACRTKYRVVERVDNHRPTTNIHTDLTGTVAPINGGNAPPASNSTVYPNSSLSSLTSQAPRHSSILPNESSIRSNSTSQRASQPDPPQNHTQNLPFPDFSLQSYMRMAQGDTPNDPSSLPGISSWAQQLHCDGVLQASNRFANKDNRTVGIHHRHNTAITSTPLDPGEVPADELNVYWEEHSKLSIV